MTAALQSLEPRRLFAVTGLPFKLGSDAFDQASKIVHTPDGGFVVAGLFSGTVDFNPTAGTTNLTSVGDSDVFVARYSATSQLLWARRFGGDGADGDLEDQDRIVDIAANPRRGGGEFVNGYGDAPLDAGEYLNALQVDAAGNVYLGGEYIDEFDADPSRRELIFQTQRGGYYNGYLIKLGAAGNLLWAQNLSNEFTSTVADLAVQTNGDVVATGLFARDFVLTVGGRETRFRAQGRADGYVMDLSSRGAVRWLAQFGSEETGREKRESGNDLALDAAGNIYVVGTYADDATFSGIGGGARTVAGEDDTDGFLAKYSPAGRLRSVLTFTGGQYSGLTHVALDSGGSLIVSGYFQREDFDADPGPGVISLTTPDDGRRSRDHTDAFVEKITAGRAAWVQQLTGDGTEFIDGLAVDAADRITLVGSFYDTANFGRGGPTIASVEGDDDFDRDANDNDRDDSYDAFVWSLTDAGRVTRVRTFGSALDDFGMGLSIGSDNSVLLTGRFSGVVDFDPGAAIRRLRGLGFGDAFISQLDANGDFLA